MEAERLRAAKTAWGVKLFEFGEDFRCTLLFRVQVVVDSGEGGLAGFHFLCILTIFGRMAQVGCGRNDLDPGSQRAYRARETASALI